MVSREAVIKVESAIRTLRNKFLESPFAFYTESAMHCYLYSLLYQGETFKRKSRVRIGEKGQNAQTILLHNEYPTLGKFYKNPKEKTLIPNENRYVTVGNRRLKPSRGAYDLAILDPDETKDLKWQRTSIAIELALNEVHPSLRHLQNDYTKITYDKDQVDIGYILYFVRRQELSAGIQKQLPKLRAKLKEYEKNLNPKVRILYLEVPQSDEESEIHLPSNWKL